MGLQKLEKKIKKAEVELDGEPFFRMTANPAADSTDVLEPCSTLANINPHETDTRLRFQTEGHAYYFDGEKTDTRFDAWQAVQNMKAGKDWPRLEYAASNIQVNVILLKLVDAPGSVRDRLTEVLQHEPLDMESLCAELIRFREELSNWDNIVQEIMLHDSEIVDLWKTKSFHACNAGTWMHSMLEHMMNGSDILPGTMTQNLNLAVDFLRDLHDEMPGLVAYRSEWTIYATRENLAGSIDLVLFDTSDGNFVLIGWKRSEKLQHKCNGYGKFMMEPLQDIPDCQGEQYRLQLNMYMWILEHYYFKKVKSMKAVCAYPNSCNEAFVDDVPDLTNVVDRLMKHRRVEAQAKRTPCDFSMPDTADLAGEGGVDAAMDPAAELIGPPGLQALPETTIAVAQDTLSALEEEAQNAEQGFPVFMQRRRQIKGANDSARTSVNDGGRETYVRVHSGFCYVYDEE
ncbi:SWA2, partial [Symbiodinium sp. KB8]